VLQYGTCKSNAAIFKRVPGRDILMKNNGHTDLIGIQMPIGMKIQLIEGLKLDFVCSLEETWLHEKIRSNR
jgi:hypothetical protein